MFYELLRIEENIYYFLHENESIEEFWVQLWNVPHVVNKKAGEFIADNERKSILKGHECVAPNRKPSVTCCKVRGFVRIDSCVGFRTRFVLSPR